MIMSSQPLHVALALALVVLAPRLSQATKQDKPAAAQQSTAKSVAAVQNPPAHENEGEGERIFAQNCSRCHNAPDGFSSRISGTVLGHMRVRASLSKHDEEELLRFFNP
jgi:cytochrome c5